MNPTQDLKYTLELLRESSMLSAMAYDAIHGNKSDDVSKNEAYLTYGRGWIDDRLERGMLHTSRAGKSNNSPIYLSRYEIESLKRAEKLIDNLYERILKQEEQ